MGALEELRYEPIDQRIRAVLAGQTVVDTRRAVLVWEPKRIVPSYAVPASEIHAEVMSMNAAARSAAVDVGFELAGKRVYDPSIPFSVHTAQGAPVSLRVGGVDYDGAGFRVVDPDLSDHVILDFRAFDLWLEEDAPNVAHPRDPFHRVDAVPGSQHVMVELDGRLLADSSHPVVLFEPPLPVRYYLPNADLVSGVLIPSPTRTWCAYKGEASYWSTAEAADVAWSYEAPLNDARPVQGLVAFFNERVDLTVDGTRLPRPVTPWSRP